MRPPAHFPRRDLEASLLEGAKGATPLLLTGPPGAGKTALLQTAAEALRAEGWEPVYLDLMGAASSPERFVRNALAVLPAAARPAHAEAIDRASSLSSGGRSGGAQAVAAVCGLWQALHEIEGRPVALILDEVTEIRSLAYFEGLRDVHRPLDSALSERRQGTLVASSFPHAARKLFPGFPVLAARPLAHDDVSPVLDRARRSGDVPGLLRGSFGWPRYAALLVEAMSDGRGVAAAWATGMAPGGCLEQACRHTYESLLLRSRGYGMSKAVLVTVAEEEGLNLTALVGRLDRSAGAVRDYLGWLIAVDALSVTRKRYAFVDGLLRCWVQLYGAGRLPTPAELALAAEAVLATPRLPDQGEAEPVQARLPSRHERLMEID